MNIVKIDEKCDNQVPCHHSCDIKIGHNDISKVVVDAFTIARVVDLKKLSDDMLTHLGTYEPQCFKIIQGRKKSSHISDVFTSYKQLYENCCNTSDTMYQQIMLVIKQAHITHRMQACMRNGYTGFTIYEMNGIFAMFTDKQRELMMKHLIRRIHHKGLDDVIKCKMTDDMLYVYFDAELNGETCGRGLRILRK